MKYQRNAADGLYIVCNVVTAHSVAPGYGTDQPAVFVGQRNGGPVEFHFTADLEVFIQRLADTFVEFGHFGFGIGIAQRKHRIFVLHLDKVLVDVAAHAHARRSGIEMFRMPGFQILQFPHQLVELLIGDDGRIQYIVVVVMAM